jgi:hypothetical protein
VGRGPGRNLPFWDIDVAKGLNTRPNRLTSSGLGLREAQNVDGFDEPGAIRRVPGSTQVGADHSGAVHSLHYFEFYTLAGALDRRVVSLAADGALRKIDLSTGALTSLTTGLVAEALRAGQMNDLLFLSSPSQQHLPTGGIKYDGDNVTPWGVLAPGDAQTVRQDFDDHTLLTGSTQATLSTSASVSQDGGGSTQVDKTGTGGATAYVQYGSGGSPLNMTVSAAGQGKGYVWLYLPRGSMQKLKASGAAVTITAGNGALSAANLYTFEVGELFPGWNLLTWVWASPSSQVGGGATLSDIDAIRFEYELTGNSILLSGVLWDSFYTTSEGAPTVANGGGTGPTGDYTYVVTFLTEYGLESNAGPASSSITVANDAVRFSAVPVSADTQVIARRIYRDISGDGVYRFLRQIDDNVSTAYPEIADDTTTDASLSVVGPPIAGSTDFDNSPPGRMYDFVIHENRIVGVDATSRITLKVGEIGNPEAFRLVDQIQIEAPITGIESHALGTLIYTNDRLFIMTGDGVSTPLRIDEANNELGCNGRRAKCAIRGLNIAVRESEVFLIAQPEDPWVLNVPILDKWRALDTGDLGEMIVIHDRSRFRIVFIPKDSDEWLVYQYGASPGVVSGSDAVDPQDLRNASWFTLNVPSGYDVKCAAMVERDGDYPELWVGSSDGRVYWMQDPGATTWANDGSTAAVAAVVEINDVPLSQDGAGRGELRYVEMLGAITGAELVASVRAAPEGTLINSVTWTPTSWSDTNPVLPIKTTTGRGGWGRLRINTFTGTLRRLRLYYVTRNDFRGPRTTTN